ncbi:hypothetical protein AVEN_217768-1 [Araneus ventricosus]|uniref:Helitron helicase-like domain-containing protein n=1 Tax=Araneus ventricosus TaxID=182803 RepID=A0A4Y2QBU6_ARAVE|nr:hypothetical protein AVEN_217768-1 [Araneus ventricosus]
MNTDEEPIAKRQRRTKERKARWLARQSQESLDRIRAVDAGAYRRRVEAETPALSQARRERYAEAHHLVRDRQNQRIRDEAIHFIEAQVETHNYGPMNIICQFRKSKNFAPERPSDGKFTSCCRKDNIRLYNSAVSFASIGTKVVDFSGGGPYVFKVHGQIRHRTSHIQSVNGQAPQYAQLYVIDSTEATKIRVNHPVNEQCNLRIRDQIDRFFRQHNRLYRSHAVTSLPVHLPNQKRVTFKDGHEEEALEAARSRQTMLESWFQLNQSDPDAQTLLNTDIPYNYVYDRNNWKRRKRGGNKIVARMYVVNVRDAERFYLRMLLLHVPGAASFKFLRTVDNVIYDTFKQAAFHRHLLNSDEE